MSGTQLLSSSERCVDVGLEAVAAVNTGLHLIPEHRLLVDRRWVVAGQRPRRVAVVSGGGSGHEPFSVGYIGGGMLAASVAGHIFTSPPPAAIAAAIIAVGKDNPDGVLVIVFNYTGDRINFGLAVERCRAAGIKVDMYISGDDSALTQVEGTAGRRGLCGTIFAFKMAGARAEQGASLSEVKETCRQLGQATGTIGVAASGCRVPGASQPLFTVGEGLLELGLGVHGEPGAATMKAGTLQEVVQTMLTQLTREDSSSRLDLQTGDQVAVMINNLGTITQLEMANITQEVISQLGERDVKVTRVYQGPLMTSLDMRGLHISVLRLVDPSWLGLLDAPTTAPAWPAPYLLSREIAGKLSLPELSPAPPVEKPGSDYTLSLEEAGAVRACLEAVVGGMPQHEAALNALDAQCGDGDCGSTFLRGITGLSKELASLELRRPCQVLSVVGEVAASSMGGSSGGIYSILFTAAAASLCTPTHSHRRSWATALRAGTDAISKYGGAAPGDRTMLDAMVPALEVLEAAGDHQDLPSLLKAMAAAADEGAKRTAHMKAGAGRATYVRAEKVKGEDAGARCVAWVLDAMACHHTT